MSASSYAEGAYSAVSANDSEDITYEQLRYDYDVDPALPANTHDEGFSNTLHPTRLDQAANLFNDIGIHSLNKQIETSTEQIEPGIIATLRRSSLKRWGSPGLDAFLSLVPIFFLGL